MGGEFTPQTVRHVFFNRDFGCCFKCGRSLVWAERGFGWSMHHRKPRGMGGSVLAIVSSAANALTLCGHGTSPDGCHAWVETNRERAMDFGFLIPRNASTPEFEPDRVRVRRDDGRWFLLTADGRAVEVDGGNTR